MANKEAKSCQGKEVFERMNYLYQISRNLIDQNINLASYYNSLMVGCAKKAVLRMEPEVKRTFCKNCQSSLIPGKTSRVRLVSKPVKAIKYTCLSCGNSKRIPTKEGYKLWWDQSEAIHSVFDFTREFSTTSKSHTGEKEMNFKETGANKCDNRLNLAQNVDALK